MCARTLTRSTPQLAWLVEHYGEYLATCNVCAFTLCVLLYFKGIYAPSSNDSGRTGWVAGLDGAHRVDSCVRAARVSYGLIWVSVRRTRGEAGRSGWRGSRRCGAGLFLGH